MNIKKKCDNIGKNGIDLGSEILLKNLHLNPDDADKWAKHFTTPGTQVFYGTPKKKQDGCFCKNCKNFYPMAEPNQDDGTLVCYGCRNRL